MWNVHFVFCVVVCCAVSLCVGVGAGVGVQCVCGEAWYLPSSQHLPTNCTECCHVCDGSLPSPPSQKNELCNRS